MQENQRTEQQQKSGRGFAAMSPERQRKIASEGGPLTNRVWRTSGVPKKQERPAEKEAKLPANVGCLL